MRYAKTSNHCETQGCGQDCLLAIGAFSINNVARMRPHLREELRFCKASFLASQSEQTDQR